MTTTNIKVHYKVDRAYVVEEGGANVVKMSQKSEKTPTQFIVPDLKSKSEVINSCQIFST